MNLTEVSLNSKVPNYRPRYDDRKGLGYGLLEPHFDVPTRYTKTYPYSEPDAYSLTMDEYELEDDLDEEELDAFVAKMNGKYYPPDSYRNADPFAMVTGNQPLGEAPMGVATQSSSPFPTMYSKRTGTGFGGSGEGLPYGGATVGFRTHRLGTGSKQGWADDPPQTALQQDELDITVDTLDQIPDPDERTLEKLRKTIQLIHQEQELVEHYML